MHSFKACLFLSGILFYGVLLADEQALVGQAGRQPNDDLQKLAAIKQLMTITGATTNSEQFSNAFSQQMVSVLRIGNPELSERTIAIVYDEVSKLVAEEFANESLQKHIYPIYAEYFTLEELKGLVRFNQSSIGEKANQVMPELIQDSIRAAQDWSQAVGPRISIQVIKRLEQEGIDIKRRTPIE